MITEALYAKAIEKTWHTGTKFSHFVGRQTYFTSFSFFLQALNKWTGVHIYYVACHLIWHACRRYSDPDLIQEIRLPVIVFHMGFIGY